MIKQEQTRIKRQAGEEVAHGHLRPRRQSRRNDRVEARHIPNTFNSNHGLPPQQAPLIYKDSDFQTSRSTKQISHSMFNGGPNGYHPNRRVVWKKSVSSGYLTGQYPENSTKTNFSHATPTNEPDEDDEQLTSTQKRLRTIGYASRATMNNFHETPNFKRAVLRQDEDDQQLSSTQEQLRITGHKPCSEADDILETSNNHQAFFQNQMNNQSSCGEDEAEKLLADKLNRLFFELLVTKATSKKLATDYAMFHEEIMEAKEKSQAAKEKIHEVSDCLNAAFASMEWLAGWLADR